MTVGGARFLSDCRKQFSEVSGATFGARLLLRPIRGLKPRSCLPTEEAARVSLGNWSMCHPAARRSFIPPFQGLGDVQFVYPGRCPGLAYAGPLARKAALRAHSRPIRRGAQQITSPGSVCRPFGREMIFGNVSSCAESDGHLWICAPIVLRRRRFAMTLEKLIDRANAHSESRGNFQFPRPTSASIKRISEHFRMMLPHVFLELVRCWRGSGSWFASLGNDYENPQHIIRMNSYWRTRRRTRRLPSHLVIFNLGFDEDCDCFDLEAYDRATGEYPIRYWTPGCAAEPIQPTFLDYANRLITSWQP